jgi:release factor glutamine methyltransferase
MPEVTVPLGQLIRDGVERLRCSGLPEPRRQAVQIWSDLGEGGQAKLFLQPEWPVDAGVAGRFQRAIMRRALGEPLAYVTGRIGFRHLSLASDSRALVPRPETEGLVELLLLRVRTGRVLDVGTGTGCIALSLAQEGAFSRVVGVDSSPGALDLARINRRLLGLPVDLVRGDLCRPFAADAFDAVISNPPNLTASEYASADGSVRNWEPASALVSGEDGMTATTRLLDEGREVLRPGGWLALEVDCLRAALAAERAGELGWSDVSVHMDLFGRERYLLARRSNTR